MTYNRTSDLFKNLLKHLKLEARETLLEEFDE